MQEVVDHYDGRAGMEADLKGDKHGLGLATIRKHRLPAQKIVILLMQLAHNVLLWARQWLSKVVPRLDNYGIVRLISQVWAIPGRLKLTGQQVQRIRLRPVSPRQAGRGSAPIRSVSHVSAADQTAVARLSRAKPPQEVQGPFPNQLGWVMLYSPCRVLLIGLCFFVVYKDYSSYSPPT